MSIIKQLTITPQEAAVIECCIRKTDLGRKSRFTLLLGSALTQNQPRTLGVSESDLWELRQHIDPDRAVGKTTGLDLIIKLYHLLLEFDHEELLGQANCTVKENQHETNDNEDRTEDHDTSEGGTEDRPLTAVES